MTYLISRSSGIFLLSLLFLCTLLSDISFAQSETKSNLLPASYSSIHSQNPSIPENLKIIGVMVEFQPDTNRFTSGNGTFDPGGIPYLEDPGTSIDALPHDQNYFEAHLKFVKNYFEKVSKNQISIDFQVLPEVYTLPKKMADYSPIGENPDLSEMVNFVADVWSAIGNSQINLNNFVPTDRIAYVIFHAGIGRDVELTGTNLDKTPQDLPSFYLSKDTLRDFLNDPSFSGFPINNEDLLVDNSLIIPRTLTRSGIDAVGDQFVLPLSINGLLTAQIGSYLGLPDLFNTENGRSGIGRFGLMDGAGIFSYNGLFPPELSAWEKIYLGWETPFHVDTKSETTINLPANSPSQNQTIAKVPLSNSEYFLIENHHRDPEGNGVTLTIEKSDGSVVTQTFTNQDETLVNQQTNFDDLLEPGVVIDVSHYDFSLPGGIVSNNGMDRVLNGGILIWHIDEGIIDAKIDRNAINNNPDRRGIDLEEADGAQDIGIPTSIGLSQNEVTGSPFDFWWSGNDARVFTQADTIQLYKNRFGPDTRPDNSSNSGASATFELFDFSDNQPDASFKIRPVKPFSAFYELFDTQSNLQIVTASPSGNPYWQRFPLAAQPMENNWIIIPGYDGVQFYNSENKKLSNSIIKISSLQQPLFLDDLFTVTTNPSQSNNLFSISTYRFDNGNITELSSFETEPNAAFISSHQQNILDVDGTPIQIDIANNEIIQSDQPVQYSDRLIDYQSKIEDDVLELRFPGGSESFVLDQSENNVRAYTGIVQSAQNDVLFYLLNDGKLSIFASQDNYQTERIIHQSQEINWPSIVDFNQDGSPDFLFIDTSDNQLIAKNSNGAFLQSFPLSSPQNVTFVGTPLIADINGDQSNEIIITGYDESSMNLYAFDQNSEAIEGFPLLIGGISNSESQPVHPLISGNKLIAVSHFGELKVWEFNNMQDVLWRSKYGNQTTNKISGFIESDGDVDPQLSLLNNNETYNWPNPAQDETQIRFQTSEPAEVRIKILTMSGRLISDQTIQSKGRIAEEILIDTSSWASGGYFALVEATSNGVKERKLIKIAIAR